MNVLTSEKVRTSFRRPVKQISLF